MGEYLKFSDRYGLNRYQTAWILVANRTSARLFLNPGPGGGFRLIQKMDHPAGRLKNGEIDSDRPGRVFALGSLERHALSTHESPHERVSQDFAREITRVLNEARIQNKYDQLYLIADPSFMGLLRKHLDKETSNRVAGTLNKDLGYLEDRKLEEYIRRIVPI